MDNETLELLIQTLKGHYRNIYCILNEQPMTIFNTEDFYKGEEHILQTLILVLEGIKEKRDVSYYLGKYQDYYEEYYKEDKNG